MTILKLFCNCVYTTGLGSIHSDANPLASSAASAAGCDASCILLLQLTERLALFALLKSVVLKMTQTYKIGYIHGLNDYAVFNAFD